jgi:predicted acetyltransferase
MGVEVRNLTLDELEPAWQLDRLAFNTPEIHREVWLARMDPERMCGVFEGSRLVAMAVALPAGQYFGGRRVAMGGLSSVAVAPEARGRGYGSQAVAAAAVAMRERGEVISALFPGTTQLYRRLGWELAGAYVLRRIPLRSLRSLPRPPAGRLRRAEPDDLEAMKECYRRLAPQVNGVLDRAAWSWWGYEKRWEELQTYLALGPTGEVEGFVSYRHRPAVRAGFDYSMHVRDLFALGPEAANALWWMLGSSATQADVVQYPAPAEDPLFLLLSEQESEVVVDIRWMLRLNDPAGAVTQRGFPPGLEAEVHLGLCGPLDGRARDESPEPWVLRVSKGEGGLEPGGEGRVSMGLGAFASLYSGWAQTATLARAGLLQGGSAVERALLDAAFAGPAPWLPEQF